MRQLELQLGFATRPILLGICPEVGASPPGTCPNKQWQSGRRFAVNILVVALFGACKRAHSA